MVPFSWSFWGGVVDHADHQARTLHAHGVDAKIIIGNDPPGRLTWALHPRPGRHGTLPDYVIPVGRTVMIPANASLANIVLSPQAMFRMKRILREQQFDILHVHEPLAPLLSAYAVKEAECPVVGTFHASGGKWSRLGYTAWGRVIESAIDHRIAVSNQARDAAARYIKGEYEIVPNGVAVPPLPDINSRRNHVVFIGRHEPRKGVQVILKAWPAIRQATGARLRVIGSDPAAVRFMMRRLGVSKADGIDPLGVLPAADLERELVEAKILVAPAVGGESFGIVLAQAFAARTAVVASSIPGYTEVVDDTTGVLVPPGDVQALSDSVTALLGDDNRRRHLADAGRARAEERFDWDTVGKRLISTYELLTGLRVRDPVAT